MKRFCLYRNNANKNRTKIEQIFNEKLLALEPNDATFEARKYSIKVERAENLDALESLNEHKKKSKAQIFRYQQKNREYHKI